SALAARARSAQSSFVDGAFAPHSGGTDGARSPRVKPTGKHVSLTLVLALSWACSSGTTRSSEATSQPNPDPAAAAVQRIPDEPRPLATSGTTGTTQTRTEHDLLGEKQIPANAYYGVQTARALE